MTTATAVGPLLQSFFTEYLVAQKRLSPQTVASYRDTSPCSCGRSTATLGSDRRR